MKTIGIIAEYNPLHYGHLYQLELAKTKYNADRIVVVMSGNFTQRGTPAIIDKKRRAELAIKSGADLVLELPSYFSSGKLEDFALGAVSIMHNTGIVDEILFGSECGDIKTIETIAEAMLIDDNSYKIIRQGMRTGITLIEASQTVLSKLVSDQEKLSTIIESINKPNNMLGIFYVLAIKKLHSKIIPSTNLRRGQDFNDSTILNSQDSIIFSSASAIRDFLYSKAYQSHTINPSIIDWYIKSCPEITRSELKKSFSEHGFIKSNAMFELFKEKVMDSDIKELCSYVDISSEEYNRITTAFTPGIDYDSFIHNASKGLRSGAKIDRCITHYVLNHKKTILEQFKMDSVTYYTSVLSNNANGCNMLDEIEEKTHYNKSNMSSLGKLQKEADLYADKIYCSLFSTP